MTVPISNLPKLTPDLKKGGLVLDNGPEVIVVKKSKVNNLGEPTGAHPRNESLEAEE
jgi:hypothetical protein